MSGETFSEYEARELHLMAQLDEHGFEGPHRVIGGGFMGFGSLTFAICVRCGAMVKLGDPKEQDGTAAAIERGIDLHVKFHDSLEGRDA